MRICLDSSIYITWLERETDDIQCLKGTEEIIRVLDSDNKQYQLVISAITLAEVLKEERYAEAFGKFEKMIDRYEIIPVDQKIAILARTISQQFKVKAPDAIHVATSLQVSVDYLCAKDRDMLKLEGNTKFAEFSTEHFGKQIKIIKPPLPNPLGI